VQGSSEVSISELKADRGLALYAYAALCLLSHSSYIASHLFHEKRINEKTLKKEKNPLLINSLSRLS